MIISELSYIETLDLQSSEISGGEGEVTPEELLRSLADATAVSTAVGPDSLARTTTSTVAVEGGAAASSSSLASVGLPLEGV